MSNSKFVAANRFLANHGMNPITEVQLREAVFDVPEQKKQQAMDTILARIPTWDLLGVKPTPTAPQPETFLLNIPDDALSIRFFTGGALPEQRLFFFDFYDAVHHIPKNAPQDYRLEIVSPPPCPLISLEQHYGEEPKEEQERFMVATKVTCSLMRPNHAPFLFDVPSRAGIAQAVPLVY
ncbi:hypothetical protein FB45DRAFT_913236 [Roridomyces roridus]|uniref:Uncharacterized protein n=1 Tax=Roridomyces roridus TaxID=1738132 RepID=A0AAD7BWZ4_9AGAR|nr:hypothetical protein FB45DRAFT_913236 [Roridomyces roridus]